MQPNILVDGSGSARIADFGVATFARDPCPHMSGSEKDWHTARWCAPELSLSDQPATKKSDVFSFGMVMIEVGSNKFLLFSFSYPFIQAFTGKPPFWKYKSPQVTAIVLTGEIPERPSHPSFTDALWELTQLCLRWTSSERPHAKQVLATLKDMDRSREVPHNQVDAQDGTGETSSRKPFQVTSSSTSHSLPFSHRHLSL